MQRSHWEKYLKSGRLLKRDVCHENLIAVNLGQQIFSPKAGKYQQQLKRIRVANQLCKSVLSRAEIFLEKKFTDWTGRPLFNVHGSFTGEPLVEALMC